VIAILDVLLRIAIGAVIGLMVFVLLVEGLTRLGSLGRKP
jgi:hypothetical protein